MASSQLCPMIFKMGRSNYVCGGQGKSAVTLGKLENWRKMCAYPNVLYFTDTDGWILPFLLDTKFWGHVVGAPFVASLQPFSAFPYFTLTYSTARVRINANNLIWNTYTHSIMYLYVLFTGNTITIKPQEHEAMKFYSKLPRLLTAQDIRVSAQVSIKYSTLG